MEDIENDVEGTASQSARRKAMKGRVYIPHGYGKEDVFKPHIAHLDVAYSDCGPDWNSRLRWLPSPKPKDGQPRDTTFCPPMKSIRHFPNRHNILSNKEYNYYPPHGIGLVYGKGKQTIFNELHRASMTSCTEMTDNLQFAGRGHSWNSRNGISESAPGDKPYQAAEYSWNFHKLGSTRPVVNFGQMKQKSVLPPIEHMREIRGISVKPYTAKEAERQRQNEIDVVEALNCWRPATPLKIPVPDPKV